MSGLLKKLGWKEDMRMYIHRCPEGLLHEFQSADTSQQEASDGYPLVLGFVYHKKEIPGVWEKLLTVSSGERIWLAYPKKSGSVQTDLNRDNGWDHLISRGFRPVSQVSLDEDWSCLRFRESDQVISRPRVSYTETPPELKELFRKYTNERSFYESLAPSHRKEYNQWIMEAKKPETRERRLMKTIEYLQAAKKNPFQ